MGISEYSSQKLLEGALVWLSKKVGIPAIRETVFAYEVFEHIFNSIGSAAAHTQALQEGSNQKRLLDSLVRSSSGFGKYYKDYCFFYGESFDDALKEVRSNDGNIVLIRLKKTYQVANVGGSASAGSFYLVITRSLALVPTEDFEIITSLTFSGGVASSEASAKFLRDYLNAIVPANQARAERIQHMQGHPKFGQQMMLNQ